MLGLAGSSAVAAIEAASVVTDMVGQMSETDGCVVAAVVDVVVVVKAVVAAATAGGNGAVTRNSCSFDGSLFSLSPFTSSMGTGLTEARTSSIVSVIGCWVAPDDAPDPPLPLLASRRSCPCVETGASKVGAEVVMVFAAKTADGGAGLVGNATVTVAVVPGWASWKAAPRDVGLDLTGDCKENRTVCCCGGAAAAEGNFDGATNVVDDDFAVETGDFFAADPRVRASCRMDVLTGDVREGGGKGGGFITAGCGSGGGRETAS